MNHVRHPGPISPIRLESHLGAAHSLAFPLEPGLCLRDAIARPLQQAGFAAAGVTLRNVRLQPFRYVIPAFARDAHHAASYSETFAPAEEVEIEIAGLTYGRRADGPFLHCHALWRDASGHLRGGHLLPFEAIVSASGQAEAFGTDQVEMLCEFDPETNFALFRPLPLAAITADELCLVARIRPNEDLTESIASLCLRHGVVSASIRSGIGSTIGMTFADGRVIPGPPTELLVLDGEISSDAQGRPTPHVTLAVIDVHGNVHQGTPARARNPVLICFELVIQVSSTTTRHREPLVRGAADPGPHGPPLLAWTAASLAPRSDDRMGSSHRGLV